MPETMKKISYFLGLVTIFQCLIGCNNHLNAKHSTIKVHNAVSLEAAAADVAAGDTLIMQDGKYDDIKLIVKASGTKESPIVIMAENPGEVFFTGDVKVELRGNYIELSGIYFKDGDRIPSQWRSHGPGLVAIYGSHCEVYDCLFHDFDLAHSAYITTSLDQNGNVPQYCRIHHCAFIEKQTLDQVINLNNTPKKTEVGEPGKPMYHRIDHCYFANPPKKGNSGGGIRVGYWRKDYGRCLIDNNLFERQDSEAEIITSKSMENVYIANTFKNCRGTLNFRHGDHQVAINNVFSGSDRKYEYGGMFIWGSDHIVGANRFELSRTLRARGGAAISLNPGPVASEHALAYNVAILNNEFLDNAGYALCVNALYENRVKAFGEDRVEYPRDNKIVHNKFVAGPNGQLLWNGPEEIKAKQTWEGNIFDNASAPMTEMSAEEIAAWLPYNIIEGLEEIPGLGEDTNLDQITGPGNTVIDFSKLIANGPTARELQRHDVGPRWCTSYPGTYADTGLWKQLDWSKKSK